MKKLEFILGGWKKTIHRTKAIDEKVGVYFRWLKINHSQNESRRKDRTRLHNKAQA